MRLSASSSRIFACCLIAVVIAVLFVIGSPSAHAYPGEGVVKGVLSIGDHIAGFMGSSVTGPLQVLVGIIKLAVWWLTRAIVGLFTFIVYRFTQEVGFVDNPFVQTGWMVVRDVANWFFIVFLLVSAIATILDIENYNARRILPKLIIVALLVNFSLFFTGFAINVSQGITSIFVSQLAGQYDDIGQAYLNGLQITNVSMADLNGFDDFIHKLSDNIRSIAEDVVAIILLLIVAGIFAFMALSLLYRIVKLWVLMILSPLAFIAAILPATESHWKDWLKDFTNWVVFGPIAVFFIWLGTWLILYLNNNSDKWGQYETNSGFTLAIVGTADKIMRYAVILIFLYMSVKVTQKLAGDAAKFAMGTISAALGAVALGAAGGGAAVGALRASQMGAAAQGRIGRVMANAPPIIRRIPGWEQTQRGMLANSEEAYAERQRQEGARLAQQTPGVDNRVALMKGTKNDDVRRGMAEVMIKSGQSEALKQLGDDDMRKLQARERQMNDSWAMRSARPDLLTDPKEQGDAYRKQPADAIEADAKNIVNERVTNEKGERVPGLAERLKTMNVSQFSALVTGAARSTEAIEKLKNALNGLGEKSEEEIRAMSGPERDNAMTTKAFWQNRPLQRYMRHSPSAALLSIEARTSPRASASASSGETSALRNTDTE